MTTKYESKKHLKSAWVSRSKDNYEDKPWGKEKTWTGFSGVHGKLLYIDSGKKTSLKFHSQKSEVLFLKAGKIKVIFGNESSFTDPVACPFATGGKNDPVCATMITGLLFTVSGIKLKEESKFPAGM